jgi:hypothetical protein
VIGLGTRANLVATPPILIACLSSREKIGHILCAYISTSAGPYRYKLSRPQVRLLKRSYSSASHSHEANDSYSDNFLRLLRMANVHYFHYFYDYLSMTFKIPFLGISTCQRGTPPKQRVEGTRSRRYAKIVVLHYRPGQKVVHWT